jgi:rubrerythrin
MGPEFNADEIFEIAEQIERNGEEFYRRSADITEESSARELLLSLAAWENQHEKLFIRMRAGLAQEDRERPLADLDEQASMYLRAAADTHVFNLNEMAAIIKGDETPEQLLRIALAFEKDSIVFFLAMREIVPEDLGKDKVNGIIDEEMSHVTMLDERIREIRGT